MAEKYKDNDKLPIINEDFWKTMKISRNKIWNGLNFREPKLIDVYI